MQFSENSLFLRDENQITKSQITKHIFDLYKLYFYIEQKSNVYTKAGKEVGNFLFNL